MARQSLEFIRKEFGRLEKQGIPMTDLQMAAARERIVFLTARRIAQHEKEDTMEALTAQGVTND